MRTFSPYGSCAHRTFESSPGWRRRAIDARCGTGLRTAETTKSAAKIPPKSANSHASAAPPPAQPPKPTLLAPSHSIHRHRFGGPQIGRSYSEEVTAVRTTAPTLRSRGDTALSIVLLVAAVFIAAVSWFTIYVLIGLTTTSSGPRPCAGAPVAIFLYPALSIACVLAGASWVAYRKARRQHAWWAAATTVAGVLVFAALIAANWLVFVQPLCR